jgi:thymidylate kinase
MYKNNLLTELKIDLSKLVHDKNKFLKNFIALEGNECTGKTMILNNIKSNIVNLKEALASRNSYKDIQILEIPNNDSDIGKIVRHYLKADHEDNEVIKELRNSALLGGMILAHAEIDEIILRNPDTLFITSRSVLSTCIYQGALRDKVNIILDLIKDLYLPGYMVVLNASTDTILDRLSSRKWTVEKYDKKPIIERLNGFYDGFSTLFEETYASEMNLVKINNDKREVLDVINEFLYTVNKCIKEYEKP